MHGDLALANGSEIGTNFRRYIYIRRYIVGISLNVWVIFGISNVTVMVHTKIIILIDVASVPSRLKSCKILLCVHVGAIRKSVKELIYA